MIRTKVINLSVLLTSLFGWLEWGTDQHGFLVTLEWEILTKLFREPASVLHPFVLLPLAGQCLLLITLFQPKPSRILSLLGIGCLALLLVFLFVIGLLGGNLRILGSTVPFMIAAVFAAFHLRGSKIQRVS